jgi:hypothetical protein
MGIRALVVVSFFALLGSSGCGSGVSGENGSDPFVLVSLTSQYLR